MGDWREATSNSIYQIIYKKQNRFHINIASPVVVLPLTGDGNQYSPVWVVRLGDIKLRSKGIEESQHTSVIEYESYHFSVNEVRL